MSKSGLKYFVIGLMAVSLAWAADPTYMHRYFPLVSPAQDDLTFRMQGVTYQPAFGADDAQAGQLKSIARYGMLTVEPKAQTRRVSYPAEEQIYYVLSGNAC
jgi:uncharacterized RmlC-like cupin family protein